MGFGADRDARVQELEERLREVSRRLEETQALARVGSWEWKLPARRARWSREMLRIFGRDADGPPPTREEMIAAVHRDDRADFERLVERIETVPGPFDHTYRIVDVHGAIHHMQARGHVIAGEDGKPVRTHGTTQDITELRESQAQLDQAKRLEAVGQLAGGVAHDFNNLLSVILNYAEHLISLGGDRETLQGLREIERAALTAAEVTKQLLLFSRGDSNELRSVDLAATVAETRQLLARTIGDHVELTVDVAGDLPPVTLAEGQAEQILVNLVVNARDAMPGGGTVSIGLRREAGPSGGGDVVLTVADDGEGMPREVAAQAFDPFFTTKPRGQGTGMGLATVYGIVGRAGGRVEIESEPGRGTEVGVHLPQAAWQAPEAPPTPAPQVGDLTGRSVLVVDNEPAVQTVVSRMLCNRGLRVLSASSAADAEAALEAAGGDVDLLLTDVQMPGRSGRELLARLHDRNPRLRAIYMTGFAGNPGSSSGRWEDGVPVLQKPFTAEQLARAVGEALGAGEAPE